MGPRFEALRRSFWAPASAAMLLGAALGLGVPTLDDVTGVNLPVIHPGKDEAGSILQTIGTVAMSVAGISFSVFAVALQLASQQLSPRVLTTFQADTLSKLVLALLVGTFVFALVALARIGTVGESPEVTLAFGIALAMAAFAFFVAFVHRVVNLLQASELIKRIAADGQDAVARRYPGDVGDDPDDGDAAERRVRALTGALPRAEVRAPRAGFLNAVDPGVIDTARRHDGLVRQRAPVGDFVVTDMLLAEVWSSEDAEALAEAACGAFEIGHERTVLQDVAFPIRQLADVALRGLSPSLNDPTTAENALGSLADTLVLFARNGRGLPVRVDGDGEPRFVAQAPTLNDLVRLGFEQVRVKSADYPVLAVRSLTLLGTVQRTAEEHGVDASEAGRQAALLAETIESGGLVEADLERVREANGRRERSSA